MSTQISMLVTESAALRGVRELAGEIGEPTTLTLLVIGMTGLMVGRIWSAREVRKARD